MTLGSIILLALLVSIIVIGVKVRSNSAKLQELDEILQTAGKDETADES